MIFKNSNHNRYRSSFMRSTEALIDRLTVKEFILYLRENGYFEGKTVEPLDERWISCDAYCIIENGSSMKKEFLISEDGRVFYWPSLVHWVELIDE